MSNFITNRNLLNPKFEGYKLAPLPQDDVVSFYSLPSLVTQANVSGRTRTPLSFQEVHSRITHNHLAIAHNRESGIYVDERSAVVQITLNAVSVYMLDKTAVLLIYAYLGFTARLSNARRIAKSQPDA